MAAISTLPNFYSLSAPTAASLNNAVKAICQQIGGRYYDEALGYYTTSVGNLDSTNFASVARLRNQQKLESRSVYSVSAWMPIATTVEPVFFAFPVATRVVGILVGSGTNSYYVSAGSILASVNNVALMVLPTRTASPASANGEPVCWSVSIDLPAGSILTLDPYPSNNSLYATEPSLAFSNVARTQGQNPVTISPSGLSSLVFTVLATSLHR